MYGILRFLLAIFVVLLHVFSISTIGNHAVHCFFIMSGFLMTLIVNDKYGFTIKGFKNFWLNRLLRLYPIYWVVITLTFLLLLFFGEGISSHKALKLPQTLQSYFFNITLIYPNVIPSRVMPRLSPASWALTNELVFYLLISLGISKTFFRSVVWFVLSLLYMIFSYYFFTQTYRYGSLYATSFLFSLGSLIYWGVKKYKIEAKFSYILVVFIIFIMNAVIKARVESQILYRILFYFNMLLSVVLVYQLYFYKPKQNLKKIDDFLGSFSYPIYIGHFFVAILYSLLTEYGVKKVGFRLELKALWFYMPLLLIISYLFVFLIDERATRLKNKINR